MHAVKVTHGHGERHLFQVAGGSSGWQVAGRCLARGEPETGGLAAVHFQVTGLSGQVSGAGVLVRVRVQENPEPEPGAEDLNLGPDGRDLRPENYLSLAPAPALALIISAIDAVIYSQQ